MKTERIYIGCDPDLRTLSFAFLNQDKKLKGIFISKVGNKDKNPIQSQLKQLTEYESNHIFQHLVTRTAHSFTGPDVKLAVESQNARYASRAGIDVQSLVGLATMSGVASTCAHVFCVACGLELRLPLPSEWKGNAPKHISQARICSKLGWDYQIKGDPKRKTAYAVPKLHADDMPEVVVIGKTDSGKPQKFNAGDWADVLDSVGLSIWSWEKENK